MGNQSLVQWCLEGLRTIKGFKMDANEIRTDDFVWYTAHLSIEEAIVTAYIEIKAFERAKEMVRSATIQLPYGVKNG